MLVLGAAPLSEGLLLHRIEVGAGLLDTGEDGVLGESGGDVEDLLDLGLNVRELEIPIMFLSGLEAVSNKTKGFEVGPGCALS